MGLWIIYIIYYKSIFSYVKNYRVKWIILNFNERISFILSELNENKADYVLRIAQIIENIMYEMMYNQQSS